MTKLETAQPQKLKIKLLKKTLKYFTMKLNYEKEMICRIRERLQFITMLGEKRRKKICTKEKGISKVLKLLFHFFF